MSAHSGNEQVRQSAVERVTVGRDIKIGSINQQFIASASKAGIPFQVPPLPAHFVERAEPRFALKALLLTQAANIPGILVVSAIHGLGGIGKSTLAAALAWDSDVEARFPDGVLWATLGQQPKLLSFLSSWIQALGDYNYKPTTPEAASTHLRTLLLDKKMLLVVDDAWNLKDVEPFRVGGSSCRLLVTTRESLIVEGLGARPYSLDIMKPEQAMELVTKKLGRALHLAERQEAEALARVVGYHPLALELAVAQVASGIRWTVLLQDFGQEVARLKSADLPGARDVTDEGSLKRLSLTASLHLSIQQLPEEEQQNFTWLGVLPEDAIVTQAMTATLWDMDERDAEDMLRYLRSKALLLPGVPLTDGTLTYRLHDLIHDLARNLLIAPLKPKRKGDLPGIGVTLAEAHAALLQHYWNRTQDHLWHTLSEDGYIHARLTWHLEKAGWVDEVHKLLREETKEGRNGWYEACERLGQTTNFVTDIARAWQLAIEMFEDSPSEAIALASRYALITASLNSLANNIPAELMAALVEKQLWIPAQGIAYARQLQEGQKRFFAIQKLAPHLPETLLPEALEAALAIGNELHRTEALSAIAPHLPEALLPKALEAALAIGDEFYNTKALSAIAPHLPEVLLPKALEAVLAIGDKYNRTKALSALAPHLPETLLPRALEAALAGSELHRAQALSLIAPHLPKTLLPKALEAARAIRYDSHRAQALSALAPYLPEMLPEALEAVLAGDELHRAQALSALAPHLPETLLPKALEAARAIRYDSHRAQALSALAPYLPEMLLPQALKAVLAGNAQALSALAPHLPETLLPKALEAALAIENESHRAEVLRKLLPYLPKTLLPEVLEAVLAIGNNSHRTKALSALAPHLPKTLLPKALEAVRAIGDEYDRAQTLSALAPHLLETLLPKALEAALAIKYDSHRAQALSALAPYLPETLLPEALEAVLAIGDESHCDQALEAMPVLTLEGNESHCDQALRKLLPYLPKTLLPKALEAVLAIENESHRVYALSALAPYLPKTLLPKALEAVLAIENESHRVYALSALAPYLPKTLLPKALEAVLAIKYDSHRAQALSALAPYLPKTLLPKALEAVLAIENESHRVYALSALAPYLPKTLLPKALEAVLAIKYDSHRAQALSALAPYLPETLLPEALEAVLAIENESHRAEVLRKLLPYLPKTLLPEVLEAVLAIGNNSHRAQALSALAPHLPSVLPEALEAVLAIVDDSHRNQALRALAPYLPKTLLPKALEAVLAIGNNSHRAQALSALAPYLPSVLPEALEAALATRHELYRVHALRELLPYLPETLLPEALEVARTIGNDCYRAIIAQGVGEVLPKLNLASINFLLWCEILRTLSHGCRRDLLVNIPNLSAAIISLGGIEALAKIARAIQDVCRQWK